MKFSYLLALCLACMPAFAEQKQDFGNYAVHYSAQNTADLSPEVAERHRIARDPKLAMVMVTVQQKSGAATAARISGEARNLLGHAQTLDMREIREGESVYYLGLFNISNLDIQTFDFSIQPEGTEQSFKLRFNQQFFVD